MASKVKITDIYIDLFCGAGGVSTGINKVKGAKVIACINHEENAINSHEANHKDTLHFLEDIKTASLHTLIKLVKAYRKKHKGVRVHLWASLDCTHHSGAAGGVSRSADSRTLANHLFRYFVLDFDSIWIENVREFLDWGPLEHKIKNGIPQHNKKTGEPVMRPIKALKGTEFNPWKEKVMSYGYNYEHRILNCADYECPTSRKRLFIQFAKPGIKIEWPKPILEQKDWKPVLPYIRMENKGESLFTKKRIPKDNTLARVKRGLIKFKGDKFIQKYYGTGSNVVGLDVPCPTIPTKDTFSVVQPFIIEHYNKSTGSSVNSPCNSILTRPKQGLVQAFLIDHQFKNTGSSLNKPCPTIIASQDKKPLYIVSTDPGIIKFNDYDTETMIDLKKYCIDNGIGDVMMRGLVTQELKEISTFNPDYILVGTDTEKKKYIGNAVPPKMVTELIKTSTEANSIKTAIAA